MNTNSKKPATRSTIEQITNNTVSWIGHQKIDNKNIIGGQTFVAPSEAELEAIEVFTSVVTTPDKLMMTLHNFDPVLKSWGPVLGTASVDVNSTDTGKWKIFNIPGLHLQKGKAYGFRMQCPHSLVGIGETVGSYQTPLKTEGQEWRFTNLDQQGQAFSYFSLAFKVDIRA